MFFICTLFLSILLFKIAGFKMNTSIGRQSSHEVKISLIIPVYNEEDAIPIFIKKIDDIFLENNNIYFELVFINDGSNDKTLSLLIEKHNEDHRIKVIDLTRNFGKEAALTAGLDAATGDVIVPIDVDLQDPPEIIIDMLRLWNEGFEVVAARRVNRNSDNYLKRTTSSMFYKLHNIIADQQIPENVGDFRLMDRKVVNALKELPETQRFMKGIFAWTGFKTTYVDYSRPIRSAGDTKFNGWKLWNFALEGLTSFSTTPLKIWSYIGLFVAFSSMLYGVYILLRAFFFGTDVPGYPSIFVAITFLGGLQILGIGVLGEYLGRTYIESKRRPIYLIRKLYENRNT